MFCFSIFGFGLLLYSKDQSNRQRHLQKPFANTGEESYTVIEVSAP